MDMKCELQQMAKKAIATNDTGAALALCQDIARPKEWYVATCELDAKWSGKEGIIVAEFLTSERHHTGYEAPGATAAEALSRLALAALEAEGE